MFHGHGALIRMSAWRAVGGFPEVVAEDLAFSTRMRECGYYGVFEDEVCCGEGFPRDYPRFYRRHLKYVKGTAEHARSFLWSFLANAKISWIEKVDRLFSTMAMISPLGLIAFFASLFFLGPNVRIQLASNKIVSLCSAFALIAPLLPLLVYRWKTYSNSRDIYWGHSCEPIDDRASSGGVIVGLFQRVRKFPVTGESMPIAAQNDALNSSADFPFL